MNPKNQERQVRQESKKSQDHHPFSNRCKSGQQKSSFIKRIRLDALEAF